MATGFSPQNEDYLAKAIAEGLYPSKEAALDVTSNASGSGCGRCLGRIGRKRFCLRPTARCHGLKGWQGIGRIGRKFWGLRERGWNLTDRGV